MNHPKSGETEVEIADLLRTSINLHLVSLLRSLCEGPQELGMVGAF